MVRHHVAERACLLVKATAPFHANHRRRCDLHIVDVLVPEYRLEHGVGEAHGENALVSLPRKWSMR